MIVRHPTRKMTQQMHNKKLAIVITKDYERVLIGDQMSIECRLDGAQNVDVDCDSTRPFGTLLLNPYYDEKGDWNTAIWYLIQALSHTLLQSSAESNKSYEKYAQAFFEEQYKTEDPLRQYAALRIWYMYWEVRSNKSEESVQLFSEWAHNLVRPFLRKPFIQEWLSRITPTNSIFRNTQKMTAWDRSVNTFSFGEGASEECIFISNSFVPIEHFYQQKLDRWKKYIILCAECKKCFFADTLQYELCSDVCRKTAQKRTKVARKNDPEIAKIDRLLAAANANWDNRLRKIRNSPEWSEEKELQYKIAMEHFQDKRRQMRKDYKKGSITYKELRGWACLQQRDAEDTMKSLMDTEQ